MIIRLLVINVPNPAVKGTRRPSAVVKFCSLIGFVGFVLAPKAARPLLLR
jgi:hypothetical protein